MKVAFKKLFIKILKLDELTCVIVKERDKQKALDKKYYENLMTQKLEKQAMDFSYERSSFEYDIKTLQEEVKNYEIKQKEVDIRDLRAKNQINANIHVATRIYSEMKDTSEYVTKKTAKMHLVMTEALDHKETVEKLENKK